MPARDPLELRRHSATVPTDLNDPPRFSQMVETTKDALVEEVRVFLNQAGFTTEKREELPTVEKYAIGFGTGLDPYQTFVKIVEMMPDVTERMPHVAVTTAAGRNRRMTAGRPFIAHTQAPPRVVTAVAGPYALSNPVPQIVSVSIDVAPAQTYDLIIEGEAVSVLVASGTVADAASTVAAYLRATPIGLIFRVSSTSGVTASVIIEHRTPGTAFSVTTSANMTATTTQAAGNATGIDMLAFRTLPGGRGSPQVSTILFPPSRFATTEPLSAVPADAICRVFNEQALWAYARPVSVGVGTGVHIETGGRFGNKTPNEIEILSTSTPSLVAALGLADADTAGAGASVAGVAPEMTVTVAGTPFTAAMVGRYFVLSGSTSSVNDGRFLITDVPATNQVVVSNASGVAEALPVDASWFIGYRDDSKNPLRPVMNRYHASVELNITIDVFAESPNERTELFDLLFGEFIFFLEQKMFTLYGRGIFDPDTYPDEHYQISIHQEVNDGGEQDFPRGEDQKNKIHACRLMLPVTTTWFIDRSVLVPSGPSAGRSWTLEAENVTEDDSLPTPS
ncbi:hypothetical protein Rctr197k_063 [Virus Rctr197k]|nr:hypothetical protein Rctr197k_063 [Virus Rctr197k]